MVAADPSARRVNGQMLVALKDEQNPALARYKARLVAIGCLIRPATGARIVESLTSTAPVSLTGVRVGIFFELVAHDGVILALDVPGAYLLAALSGPATWLHLGPELAPPSWKGLKQPVVLVERALYGLPRSGEDWSGLARRTLLSHGFEYVADIGEE